MAQIKATELRIGNLLQYNVGELNPDWVNNKVDIDDIFDCDKENEVFNENYRPIELTEKVLDKIGAENGSIKVSENTELFVCVLEGFNKGKVRIFIHEAPVMDIPCLYLHTLQNIFNSLTGGKELEFNER